MPSMQVSLVIVTGELTATGTTRWTQIRELALRAEEMGLDTVWVIDELLWHRKDGTAQGFWDGVAMAGAMAPALALLKAS